MEILEIPIQPVRIIPNDNMEIAKEKRLQKMHESGGKVYLIFADTVMIVHFLFIAFVVGGGLLALRWRWRAFLHLPAVFRDWVTIPCNY